jgi:hypothetical protein
MGPSLRGGAYTYDWIENLLDLNMHSVDRVLPEFQHPQVGESVAYGKNRMNFAIVDPEHDGRTRLISRNRLGLPRLRDRIGMLPMGPASLVMERKMLAGIKQRAERLAAA